MNQGPAARHRPFNDRRPLNPRICPIAIDANALNRDGSARDGLVDRLMKLWAGGTINLIVPKGVRQEILDPRTPGHIQEAVAPMIFTISVGLNPAEEHRRQLIERKLQGNARPGRHTSDADHLSEAAKYGGYFITHDKRILDRTIQFRSLLPPSLTVVTLAEFFEIFDGYETGQLI
jgi:hypothetical protein